MTINLLALTDAAIGMVGGGIVGLFLVWVTGGMRE